ncbi:MAG: aminotransferase class I/II-fold pyridoxal phosphate-dependent enzyme [Candidatus Micrarchaeota archaeon]|nr:aminotransferase class I/II-fold pyridoxal phosphate-dependent enzyme [Candidatus Micrarchaeota archaeon]
MNRIEDFVRDEIKKMEEISWGETPKGIVLKWGENPFSPSEKVAKAVSDAVKNSNRCPDPLKKDAMKSLSKYTGVPPARILLVNGTDKAFRLLAETFIEKGDEVLSFSPSYMVIDSAVEMMGGKMIYSKLNSAFEIYMKDALRKITEKTKMIYICNPNNPTSNFIATDKDIRTFLETGKIVVVDEAYYEFSEKTCSILLEEFDNLIILRSLSKGFGLAGLRVGYVLSSEEIIKYMKKVEDTIEIFNIPMPSLAGAKAALDDAEYMKSQIKRIKMIKDELAERLKAFGITCLESKTSFLFIDLKQTGMTNAEFTKKMKENGIIVKDCSIYKDIESRYAHIGIPEENDMGNVMDTISRIMS